MLALLGNSSPAVDTSAPHGKLKSAFPAREKYCISGKDWLAAREPTPKLSEEVALHTVYNS